MVIAHVRTASERQTAKAEFGSLVLKMAGVNRVLAYRSQRNRKRLATGSTALTTEGSQPSVGPAILTAVVCGRGGELLWEIHRSTWRQAG